MRETGRAVMEGDAIVMGDGVWYHPPGAAEPIWLDYSRYNTKPSAFWVDQVQRLYQAEVIEADEMDRLLEPALRGERPEHPDLPLFMPPS